MESGRQYALNHLSEEHESIVSSEVFGEELHAITLQRRDSVLLSCIESCHHSLWTNVNLIRVQKPAEEHSNVRNSAKSDSPDSCDKVQNSNLFITSYDREITPNAHVSKLKIIQTRQFLLPEGQRSNSSLQVR